MWNEYVVYNIVLYDSTPTPFLYALRYPELCPALPWLFT